ncbi:MAG: YkgJ family cysteine cluster protein [Candidatus Heimdallarchaeaceae archaeon]|jgi:Fe-S-cluster containining protein
MASRFLICEDIEKKAEEDLLSILISDNPEPKLFNYSPYILRRVNEKLLEEGRSIGLGYISDKKLVDLYWESNPYEMKNDLEMRIIYGSHVECPDEILLFLKDDTVRNKLLSDLESIPKLRIRNNYLFRFRTHYRNSTIDEICEQIRSLAVEKNLKVETEIFYLETRTTEIDNFLIHWNIPEKLLFKCLKCNFCEYPSNFSANPIPNNLGNVKEFLITFENRICFPCNLPSLSYSEAIEISEEYNYSLHDISKPIFGKEKVNIEKIEVSLCLKQKNGLCIFQEKKTRKCKIYNHAPFHCKFYPFLVSKIDDKEIVVDLDYSCPGVGKGSSVIIENKLSQIQAYLNQTTQQFETSIDEIENIWGKQIIWKEGERVTEEDVMYSKSAFF